MNNLLTIIFYHGRQNMENITCIVILISFTYTRETPIKRIHMHSYYSNVAMATVTMVIVAMIVSNRLWNCLQKVQNSYSNNGFLPKTVEIVTVSRFFTFGRNLF